MQGSRYEKIDKIGEGAYAFVYKAKDRVTSELVALKRVRLDNDEEGVPCTAIREISLLRELRHDNIVRLLDVVHSDRKLTLVFEFLDQDLRKYLDVNGPCDAATCQHFFRQLLSAVEYCHARSVLHRDLKPQNLLISRDKVLKLADFGLGRSYGIPVRKFTHEVVTLWYRSPDVLLGSNKYGTSVDLWSLGCILAEMATGKPFVGGRNDAELLLQIFQRLGTPNDAMWPSMREYQNSSALLAKPEFQQEYPGQWQQYAAPDTQLYQCLGAHGVDLLRQLLQYEPSQRISASQALRHPYFSQSPR